MKRKDCYRVAVIGCGNIAMTGHLPAVLEHPRFDLRGLCDLSVDRLNAARKLCESRDVAVSTNYESLIADHEFDACILALHPEHSVEIAIALLKSGIAVLGEKPLATNVADGMRLAKTVEETSGIYQIGFCLRYSELFREVATMTKSIGRPSLFQVAVYDESLDQCRGAYGETIHGILRRSSAITHEGSHVIDWMSVLHSASIRAVHASAMKTLDELPGPNFWVCKFDYADGSTLQLNIGWVLRNQPPTSLRILGPNGWLDVVLFQGTGHFASGPETKQLRLPPMRQCWREQLDAFAEAIDRGKATVATVHDGLRALRATLACEQSVAENRTLTLEDETRVG